MTDDFKMNRTVVKLIDLHAQASDWTLPLDQAGIARAERDDLILNTAYRARLVWARAFRELADRLDTKVPHGDPRPERFCANEKCRSKLPWDSQLSRATCSNACRVMKKRQEQREAEKANQKPVANPFD